MEFNSGLKVLMGKYKYFGGETSDKMAIFETSDKLAVEK
jgi:hypothetical protein